MQRASSARWRPPQLAHADAGQHRHREVQDDHRPRPAPEVENHVLQPVIYGRTVQLSPLAVLVAVLIGAELAGVLGALMAIPVAGSIQAIVRELLLAHREGLIETPPGAALAAPNDSG